MRNNYFCLLSLFYFGLSSYLSCLGQDKQIIYLVDESVLQGKIVELTARRLKYQTAPDQTKTIEAREVMMVFNKEGNFLLFPPISDEAARSFLNSRNALKNDLIINLDKQVIVSNIISITETEVLFEKPEEEGEFALGKEVLAVILFKNGKHQLYVSPSQSAEILGAVKNRIDLYKEKPTAQIETADKDKLSNKKPTSNQPDDIQLTEPTTKPTTTKPTDGPLAADSKEYELLRKKSTQKIAELNNLLKTIIDNRVSPEKVRESIDRACALFVDDEARIEVTSSDTRDKYKIRDYLARLSLRGVEYKKVEVDYTNLNYAMDLKKSEDGSYKGTLAFSQNVKGLKNGKPAYGTLSKHEPASIQKPPKSYSSDAAMGWDVFFSDIGVFETRK